MKDYQKKILPLLVLWIGYLILTYVFGVRINLPSVVIQIFVFASLGIMFFLIIRSIKKDKK